MQLVCQKSAKECSYYCREIIDVRNKITQAVVQSGSVFVGVFPYMIGNPFQHRADYAKTRSKHQNHC